MTGPEKVREAVVRARGRRLPAEEPNTTDEVGEFADQLVKTFDRVERIRCPWCGIDTASNTMMSVHVMVHHRSTVELRMKERKN